LQTLAVHTMCIAGVDAANNDNVDFGGNQAAIDNGNRADQFNIAGRKKLLQFQANGQCL